MKYGPNMIIFCEENHFIYPNPSSNHKLFLFDKRKKKEVKIEIVCNKFDMIVSFYGFMNLSLAPFATATLLKYEFGKNYLRILFLKNRVTRTLLSIPIRLLNGYSKLEKIHISFL